MDQAGTLFHHAQPNKKTFRARAELRAKAESYQRQSSCQHSRSCQRDWTEHTKCYGAVMVPARMFREKPHSQNAATSTTKQDIKPSCMVNAGSIFCEATSVITRINPNQIAGNIGTEYLDQMAKLEVNANGFSEVVGVTI